MLLDTVAWSVPRSFADLQAAGYTIVLGATRQQVDLRDQAAVNYWFKANRPEYVFLVAGTVGGILANSTRPAEFIYDNLMIHATIAEASRVYDVKRLLYLGSSCIYPRECPQPIREDTSSVVRSSRRTSLTRSPRSPAFGCVKPTDASMDATSSLPCRRICTAPGTTSI